MKLDRNEYIKRMRKSVQFRHFDIKPLWTPGEGDIHGFIHDEVVRQYHDPKVWEDGGCRIEWMKEAWDFATNRRKEGERYPTVDDVLEIARLVEPQMNQSGFRKVYVSVGDRQCPPPNEVPRLVAKLWGQIGEVIPEQERNPAWYYKGPIHADDFYLEFEWIHPFVDGNGRTGKILHNWLLDTLDNPVLVKDYFNGGNP